jgi:hypothetical protein
MLDDVHHEQGITLSVAVHQLGECRCDLTAQAPGHIPRHLHRRERLKCQFHAQAAAT